MKVGILTFHRAHNYGAVLQCYALQEVLKSMGHEVWVVDYRQKTLEEGYHPVLLKKIISLLSHPRNLLSYMCGFFNRYSEWVIFDKFRRNYLNIDRKYKSKIQTDLDCYIIGSDQVWGFNWIGGVDMVYFGNFEHSSNSRVVGYAVSTNEESLKTIKDRGLSEYIKRIDCLSMREKFASDYLERELGIHSHVCLDPTLLTKKETWGHLINDKWANEKYVLMYQVRYPAKQSERNFLRRKADILAKSLNCRVVDLSSNNYSVEDFVSLFKYAQYVVTSSFHGTVFSLIFETPFYTFQLNDGHDGRCKDLLCSLGLSRCFVDIGFTPILQTANLKDADMNIDGLKLGSLEFLANI